MATAKTAYRKKYNIRRAIPNKNSLEVTFPYAVVEKEARTRGLTVDEFIERYKVIAQYNAFEGVHYIFEERQDNDEQPK